MVDIFNLLKESPIVRDAEILSLLPYTFSNKRFL